MLGRIGFVLLLQQPGSISAAGFAVDLQAAFVAPEQQLFGVHRDFRHGQAPGAKVIQGFFRKDLPFRLENYELRI